jgi:hypothetical protein
MNVDRSDVAPIQSPLRELERTLIEEFVRTMGYDPHHLGDLAHDEREALLTEASVYASMKLAEIDSRSHFIADIHSSGPGVPKPHPAQEHGAPDIVPFRKRNG